MTQNRKSKRWRLRWDPSIPIFYSYIISFTGRLACCMTCFNSKPSSMSWVTGVPNVNSLWVSEYDWILLSFDLTLHHVLCRSVSIPPDPWPTELMYPRCYRKLTWTFDSCWCTAKSCSEFPQRKGCQFQCMLSLRCLELSEILNQGCCVSAT